MEPFQSWIPEKVSVSKILPNENNPRTITKAKLEKLKKDMEDLGLFKPLICRYDYSLLGGTQRTRIILSELPASFELWITRPPHDLAEEEYQKVLLLDNSHSGEWDIDALANQYPIELLKEIDIELPKIPFDDEKLELTEEQEAIKEAEKKWILEIQLPNEMELRDLYDDLIYKGYIVKDKS